MGYKEEGNKDVRQNKAARKLEMIPFYITTITILYHLPVVKRFIMARCTLANLCSNFFIHFCQNGVPSRALDIGCAVGRASFELARIFQEVVGIDFSLPFVNACNQLKEQGQLPYTATIEGNLTIQHDAVVPQDIVSILPFLS